jgi:hypothetical protein
MEKDTNLTQRITEDLGEARLDVDASIEVWRDVIETRLGDRIDYAIVKGSATKKWESFVDYVPIISDLDIHIGTKGDHPLFTPNREGFLFALETTRLVEEKFLEIRPRNIHIPRPQIVIIKNAQLDWLPEKSEKVIHLYGETTVKPHETVEGLRARDLSELQGLGPLLERLPERVIDRIDLEYYRILRMLSYIVSPSPVRVLSQIHDDPKHLWSLNRTHVILELRKYHLGKLGDAYSDYYLAGWRAFLSGFKDNEAMRHLLKCAYAVLENCHNTINEK